MTPLVIRFAGLAATALLLLAALGAGDPDLQASARIVLVTAVFGLLAPPFWPGRANTPGLTALRIAGWSLAVSALAGIAAMLSGIGSAALPRAAAACAVLFVVLVVVHAVAAALELLLQSRTKQAGSARESAAWLATAALATLAATPLWLGPAAELASAGRPQAVDAAVAVSPLTHLAVATGNDLLRNQWFYQHSNLAGLRFDYPRLAPVMIAYCLLAAALFVVTAALPAGRRPAAAPPPILSTEEHRS
jgi:hypothetical protein